MARGNESGRGRTIIVRSVAIRPGRWARGNHSSQDVPPYGEYELLTRQPGGAAVVRPGTRGLRPRTGFGAARRNPARPQAQETGAGSGPRAAASGEEEIRTRHLPC